MLKNGHIYKKLLIGLSVGLALLVCLIFVATECANAGAVLKESEIFGLGDNKFNVNAQVGVISNGDIEKESTFEASQSSLSTYSTRDISTALSAISYKIELAAKAAAEAARAEELVKANNAKNRRNEHIRKYGLPEGLSDINWDVTKAAFIAEWAMRINRYFLGTPLADTGEYFAEAAWEYGIDPRFSAAIANTESGKGFNCFASHNAWGWGESSWDSWEDAIWSHVHGLATKYGYTITQDFADIYCPPNKDNWYNNTLSEMTLI